MGIDSRMITSSAHWGSSDSDDDDEYNVSPIRNTMARKKKTKVVIPVAKTLNPWQKNHKIKL